MKINLRSVREKAGKSQAELATLLGLSQAQISRYEQDPGSIPTKLLLRWAQVLGTDIATLVLDAVPLPPPLDAGEPYVQLRHDLNLLEEFIDAAPSVELDIPNQPPTSDDLKKHLSRYRQKPNLVLVGRFDSGKSHLANTLMGGKFLPSQYQPATRVITFVRHIQDRPTWFDGQVYILEQDFWPKYEKGNQVYDLTLLDSQAWCERHCIKAGSLEVLSQYGLHNHLETAEREGHSAVVYIDSPLLKACNIIDFPGYSDQSEQTSEDVEKANSAVQIADLVLYTSPANGFMNAEDISHLSFLLRVLPSPESSYTGFPTLGNFFIVATHASPNITEPQLEQILNVGSVRFHKQINTTILEPRGQQINHFITQKEFQKRFFAFWEETPNRWVRLKDEIVAVLGQHLPQSRRYNIDREISNFKYKLPEEIAEKISAYEQTIAEVELRRRELEQLEKEDPERKAQIKQSRREIHQEITMLCHQTESSFKQKYKNIINSAAIESIIQRHYDSKKDAKEYAAGYLTEQLKGYLETSVKEKSDLLKVDIDDFLGIYEEALLKLFNLSVESVCIPFDSKGAFIGGLAGLGGVGALAVWAAALGNLGAYILVAKAVGLLATLGISISGGVATAVSFVAAIGGPITLAIGLVAAAAFIGWTLFGESWQSRLAKKIVSHFESQQIVDKFCQAIDEYWTDTAKAFDKGADAVEDKFQAYIQHLREVTSNDTASKERIEHILHELRKLQAFFAGIPWKFCSDRKPGQNDEQADSD